MFPKNFSPCFKKFLYQDISCVKSNQYCMNQNHSKNIPKFYLDNRWKFKGISIGTFRFKLNATSLKMHQDKCAFQTLLFSNAPSICEFKSSAISRRKLLITVFVPEKSLALA